MNHRALKMPTRLCLVALITASSLGAHGTARSQSPSCTQVVAGYATFTSCTGTLASGAIYGIQIPDDWNGTLVLFSGGYTRPGETVTSIFNLVDALSRRWFLENGYALAGSFAGTGLVIEQTLHSQIETLDTFASLYGPPTRTIAYGNSFGGFISAALVQQHPERFSGALSFAGPLAGTVGLFNQLLDVAFVIQQLLGPGAGLEIVHVTDPVSNVSIMQQVLNASQNTPEGRSRIALACAMGDIPGWFDPRGPEPAADDYAAQEASQFRWLANPVLYGFLFGTGRVDLEARMGGNPTWNTEVNYERQLENSIAAAEVESLYAAAGLDLEADLARLADAPRIAADPGAVEHSTENFVVDGDLGGVPVLTVQVTGDGLVVNQNDFAYRSVVLQAKDGQLLRETFVHRAGHGAYTPAERIAAFQTLLRRIDTGKWNGSTDPEALNASASALGPLYNVLQAGGPTPAPTEPAYFAYEPAPFLRPFSLGSAGASAGRRRAELDRSLSTHEPSIASSRSLAAWPLPYRGGSLHVSFAPEAGLGAEVGLYDISGRKVRALSHGLEKSGAQTTVWDGRDDRGVALGTGIYFLRVTGRRAAQLKVPVIR